MNHSKFGCPDRYEDRVSKEVQWWLERAPRHRAVATCLAVRFLGSPRGLAAALACAGPTDFRNTVQRAKHGLAYSLACRSGPSKKQVAAEVERVAAEILELAPFEDKSGNT